MGREGYIKNHRKTLDNPIVCKDTEYFTIWHYLLYEAKYRPCAALFGGKKIMLEPGQLTIGRKQVAEHFNISESKVQRVLKTFENEQMIEQQTSNKNRLITIVEWEQYQTSEQQTEQKVNSHRTAIEHQLNTPKEGNNRKKERKIEIYKRLPPELCSAVDDFLEMRRQIKCPATDRALEIMLKKLESLSGGDTAAAIEILEQSIEKGWKTVYPLKGDREKQKDDGGFMNL